MAVTAYTKAAVDSLLTGKVDTSSAPELIRDTMGTALVAGTNVTVTVDDPGNTVTIAATGGGSYTDEQVRDVMGVALVAGAGISKTVNDPADTITIAATGAPVTAGTTMGQIPVWDGDSYEPQTPATVTAADVPFSPTGSIAATNVQAAVAEAASEAIPLSQKGANSGVATLDTGGQVPASQLGNAPGGGGTVTYDWERHNLKGWTGDAQYIGVSKGTTVAGALYLCRVDAPKSVSITNVLLALTTVATGITLGKVGLYNASGTLLGGSADQSADWNSATGLKTIALTGGPYTTGGASSTDKLYLAVLSVGGSVQPQFAAFTSHDATTQVARDAGLSFARVLLLASQTDLPSSVTLGSMTATANKNFWMAAS
jgi:hypothetical protein